MSLEDLDCETRITEKLKSTGRISLSDITAATIGPLDADSWEADLSDGANNMEQNSVHRPWTSVSEEENVTEVQRKDSGEKNQGCAYISVEPLLTSAINYNIQEDVKNLPKRIRLETDLQETYSMTASQQSKDNNSKQFNYSALAQSVNGPENYNALSLAIKSESGLELENSLAVNKPSSSKIEQTQTQPWTQTRSQSGPFINSIPVGKFSSAGSTSSSTFPNPAIPYCEPKFQPWTQGYCWPGLYRPSTPVTRKAVLPETGAVNQMQQSGYTTPVNKQRLSMNDTKQLADSPGFDSRFNDSLTNLLGSPPSESPISKNPFFNALQNVLESDCKKEIVPQSLMNIHTHKQENDNIFVRERKLHERFNALQENYADEVQQLSGFYRYQSALIETERFRTLHECNYPLSYKDVVNKHYDDQLHSIMDRVEQSVVLLEISKKENKLMNKGGKPRPHLNKEAVKVMEDWYEQNLDHPYPSSATYEMLALTGNVNVEQVKKWFANKRNRTHNTRTLTEIAMKKRKLNLLSN